MHVANTPHRLFHYSCREYFILHFRARDSGILITLSWHRHIHQVSNKIHRVLRYLKFNKDLLSKQVHDTLISLVHPPSSFPFFHDCEDELRDRSMHRGIALFVPFVSSINWNFPHKAKFYDNIAIVLSTFRNNCTKLWRNDRELIYFSFEAVQRACLCPLVDLN